MDAHPPSEAIEALVFWKTQLFPKSPGYEHNVSHPLSGVNTLHAGHANQFSKLARDWPIKSKLC